MAEPEQGETELRRRRVEGEKQEEKQEEMQEEKQEERAVTASETDDRPMVTEEIAQAIGQDKPPEVALLLVVVLVVAVLVVN